MIGKYILSLLYAVLKLFPTNEKKILFLSRQSDKMSVDFSLLKHKLEELQPDIHIVAICNRLDDSKSGLIGFTIDTFRSMYHLSTSKVCVLDAYWPAVSILKHKKELTVIQMWHSLGKIKKSGYQTLNKKGGRSKEFAELLCMHKNYDIVIAGGEAWNNYYCESFDIKEEIIRNYGLPRIDYLLNNGEKKKENFFRDYPQLKGKKIILYAPTFRRNKEILVDNLVGEINFDEYALIIKKHPIQDIVCHHKEVLYCKEYTSLDILTVCDCVITDYSAIAVEAAVLNKKTYYYVYDIDDYIEDNGLNVNPFMSMPGLAFMNAKELVKNIEEGTYNQDVLDAYRNKYLPKDLYNSTNNIAKLVLSLC